MSNTAEHGTSTRRVVENLGRVLRAIELIDHAAARILRATGRRRTEGREAEVAKAQECLSVVYAHDREMADLLGIDLDRLERLVAEATDKAVADWER